MASLAFDSIATDLDVGNIVVIDGGTGTELERRGAAMHSDVWCAMATLSAPETLRGVHEDYIRAGSRIITTNTFSAGLDMLQPAGLEDKFESMIRTASEVAFEARDRMNANSTVAIAGSMSHQLPLPPGTDNRDPQRMPSVTESAQRYQRMAELLAAQGVDLIVLEMMSDPAYAAPALRAAKSTGLPVWLGYTCRRSSTGHAKSWTLPDVGVDELVAQLPPTNVHAAGIMHTSIELISECVRAIRDQFAGPISAYPDTGHFEMPSWNWTDSIEPSALAERALGWIDEGAQIIGGCCGTGVEHIEAISEAVSARSANH